MTKRCLSVLLVAVVIMSVLSACAQKAPVNNAHKLVTEATTERTTDTMSFKLSYSQSDSLNPFESKTLNNQVVENLVFDSLFAPDESFEAQPSIATSYKYTNSTSLVVTIPSGLVFSNGTKLTAGSVVRSFNEAKTSPHWGNMLKGISSAERVSSTAIKFKLAYKNTSAHKLLTFAITAKEPDKKGFPVGSGRYRYGKGNGMVYLKVNKKRTDFKPHFTKIVLVNITSEESIENAINIGNISYAFRDMSSNSTEKMLCSQKPVNLTNFVYLGVNNYSGITSDENVRRAISLALDRDTIVKSAYRGYAKSATSPFHPNSDMGKESVIIQTSADIAASKQVLSQSEYSENDLKLDILVNKNGKRRAAAKLIKQQLEAAGFKITVNYEKDKTYRYMVKHKMFDLYIGETKIPNDMNMLSFFSGSGATRYGINTSKSKTAKAYRNFLFREGEIGSFVLSFTQEMPFIPLVYRQGMICYTKSMQGDMQGYADNYFSNIEDWYFN